jgi:hypothetical protein
VELVHLAQVGFSKCGAITTDTGVIFNNLECITSISLPSILLPTDLVSFSAVTNNYHVELGWQTASEVNNDFFNIERSTDAINFISIFKINGGRNSSQILNYSMIEDTPLNGRSYY